MRQHIHRLLALTILALAAPAGASGGSVHDGSHDMDFTLGTWRTEITTYSDPFGHPDQSSRMSGTKTARPLWNGKGIIEEIEADGPGGHWQAANVFLYDPEARQWSQNYVDSATGRLEGPPGVGELHDGTFEYDWQASIGGKAVLERGIWSDFSQNSHTYSVERSNDGGRTWHASFVAHLIRIQ